MAEDYIKLADLPKHWEAEAEEIDARRESGEVTGEVWDARYDILTENAADLRLALAKAQEKTTDSIPTSAYRLLDYLTEHYPRKRPESNDVCDLALAKLQELQELVDGNRQHAKV